jgi:hypothetical protein
MLTLLLVLLLHMQMDNAALAVGHKIFACLCPTTKKHKCCMSTAAAQCVCCSQEHSQEACDRVVSEQALCWWHVLPAVVLVLQESEL